MPSRPSAPIFGQRSRGKAFVLVDLGGARRDLAPAAKRRTVSRSASISSPSAKFDAGRGHVASSSRLRPRRTCGAGVCPSGRIARSSQLGASPSRSSIACVLDRAEAANLIRQRQTARWRLRSCRLLSPASDSPCDQRLVVRDQRALAPALRGIAEEVERVPRSTLSRASCANAAGSMRRTRASSAGRSGPCAASSGGARWKREFEIAFELPRAVPPRRPDR